MEKPGTDVPVIIGQAGPLNGQRWAVDRAMIIGRDTSCDIVIPDRQVSRFHARLTLDNSEVRLEDLASKNGTYCNSQRIDSIVSLQDGDVIQVALVQSFVFLSSDATMPMEGGRFILRQRTGRLFLDNRSRRVWVGEEEIVPPLSAPQFRLLQLLYDQQGKVVSRQDLVTTVWGDEESAGVSEQALDALVRRLRDRLVSMDPTHTYIITVRGHGLRMDNPVN
jgi:DNA-binding winged helix-turn-helix (wHTH) protein